MHLAQTSLGLVISPFFARQRPSIVALLLAVLLASAPLSACGGEAPDHTAAPTAEDEPSLAANPNPEAPPQVAIPIPTAAFAELNELDLGDSVSIELLWRQAERIDCNEIDALPADRDDEAVAAETYCELWSGESRTLIQGLAAQQLFEALAGAAESSHPMGRFRHGGAVRCVALQTPDAPFTPVMCWFQPEPADDLGES